MVNCKTLFKLLRLDSNADSLYNLKPVWNSCLDYITFIERTEYYVLTFRIKKWWNQLKAKNPNEKYFGSGSNYVSNTNSSSKYSNLFDELQRNSARTLMRNGQQQLPNTTAFG